MIKFMVKKYDTKKPYRISVGHCNSPKNGEMLLEGLKKTFIDLKFIELYQVGSAIGVHAGPGTLVIGIQEIK